MAETNHLVSLFEQCKLDDVPNHHVLSIDYPVRGLLPKDFVLSLKPPANLKDREAPPHDQRRMGVYQSACRLHLATKRRENPNEGFSDMFISQHNAFESLTCGPGESHLEAVSFYDSELEEEVIRLSLRVSLRQDADEHHYDFELSPKQWQQLVDEGDSPWVAALEELMTRRSHRAYYHVRNRIACDYGWDDAVAEENVWREGWGSDHLRQLERESTTLEDINQMMEMVEL